LGLLALCAPLQALTLVFRTTGLLHPRLPARGMLPGCCHDAVNSGCQPPDTLPENDSPPERRSLTSCAILCSPSHLYWLGHASGCDNIAGASSLANRRSRRHNLMILVWSALSSGWARLSQPGHKVKCQSLP